MKKSLVSSLLFCSVSLIQFSAHASNIGSYLFCVNKENSSDWKWAPITPKGVHEFEKRGASGSKRGTWVDGTPSLNSYLHPVLEVSTIYKDVDEAKQFCTSLQKICTKSYGEDYSHIGTSGGIIPAFFWNYIGVNYYGENKDKIKSSACENWTYTEFPNKGGVDAKLIKAIKDTVKEGDITPIKDLVLEK
ncbi:hypothetical protein [Fluviispira vulneris]|uniref:hypothetical protein n=1 Tax=Fluviispira vulneris TaxID=2763012 RepID=UPI0016449154|nr:hypothetical protein [Fluviispira vulneris]